MMSVRLMIALMVLSAPLFAEYSKYNNPSRPLDSKFYRDQEIKKVTDKYNRAFSDSYSAGNRNPSAWVEEYNKRQSLQQSYSAEFRSVVNSVYGNSGGNSYYGSMQSNPYPTYQTNPSSLPMTSPVAVPPPAALPNTTQTLPAPQRPVVPQVFPAPKIAISPTEELFIVPAKQK